MKYKRVLIKLSGEALAQNSGELYDNEFISRIAQVISACRNEGVETAVLVGAGNIWRGRQGSRMDRCRADSMGMLATVINSIALQDAFLNHGLPARVMTATHTEPFADYFNAEEAKRSLAEGQILIFGGGSGHPYFSTDTAAALRAAQINADIILLAKNIDGIYDRDPNGADGEHAKKFDSITCSAIIAGKLHAIDLTAATLNMESGIPALAFALNPPSNILRAVSGEQIGTLILPQ